MNTAIVTLTDDRFSKGTQCLLHTLKKYNKDIQPNVVQIDCSTVDPAPYSKIPKKIPALASSFYLFECFKMDDYDRIIFIDSDIICQGDVSLLWSERLDDKPLYFVPDRGINVWYRGGAQWALNRYSHEIINTGVLVVNKSLLNKEIYNECIRIGEYGPIYHSSDQGVINELVHLNGISTGTLPFIYNVLKRVVVHEKPLYDECKNNIRLLHYTGSKPWLGGEGNKEAYGYIEEIWHKEYEEIGN